MEAASQGGDGAAEITDPPAATAVAAEQTAASTTGNPPHPVNRPPPQTFVRAPPRHTLGRSSPSSSVVGRHRFDWQSVTAPPPPAPPLQRPNGVAPPFSTSLHRPGPLHPDRELRPAFAPPVPAAGNLYPLQYPHIQHQGAELGRESSRGSSQVFKCSGPEKEYRRCFTQVGSSFSFSMPPTPSHTLSLLTTSTHFFSLLSHYHSNSLPLHPTKSFLHLLSLSDILTPS